MNIVDVVFRPDGVPLPALEVFEAETEDKVREIMRTHSVVQYAVMKINGQPKKVVVAREGVSLTLRGKMSTFGGPKDTGMKPREGLAIIRDKDIQDRPDIAALFEDKRGPALGRRLLNKQASYIACRWDYKTTSRLHLLDSEVIVRNPLTGKTVKAKPADWGPAEWTNRVADLSDFAVGELGLKTDDVCEVIIPLPKGANGPVLPAAAGSDLRGAVVAVARGQFERFHGIHEGNEPLSSRIKGYWDELQGVTGAGFVFEDTGVAWSAVFVCWCLMQGGVQHADFGFAVAHSRFVFAANKRRQTDPVGRYTAQRIEEYAPKPGDIIQNNRAGNSFSFDQAVKMPQYKSHSAIVVAVGEDDQGLCAITVGGNEEDGVGMKRLPLDGATGKLVPRKRSPYISIIKLD
ncbi:MAG: DUF2272 domain-containing protein [Prosthecobacter sp.]|uniref:DUF2272 domain-containing protein n=1 Tax=Prosthecobacter sp. TaxID=1965333 RepID=UPI0038FE4F5C